MDVFKDQWEKQVRVLTEAVDDITSVDDFLSVSGNHHKQVPYKAAGGRQLNDIRNVSQMSWVCVSGTLLRSLSFFDHLCKCDCNTLLNTSVFVISRHAVKALKGNTLFKVAYIPF